MEMGSPVSLQCKEGIRLATGGRHRIVATPGDEAVARRRYRASCCAAEEGHYCTCTLTTHHCHQAAARLSAAGRSHHCAVSMAWDTAVAAKPPKGHRCRPGEPLWSWRDTSGCHRCRHTTGGEPRLSHLTRFWLFAWYVFNSPPFY